MGCENVVTVSILLGVLAVVLLTAMTGYFVAQEFAYVAVDRVALRGLAQTGDDKARRALDVTERLSFTLSGAQLGITVTALLVGYVSEPLIGQGIADLISADIPYAVRLTLSTLAVLVFSTVLQMVFGELAPKNLAIARTIPLARALAPSTLLYLKIAGPIIRLFDTAAISLLRRLGIEPVEELGHGATAEELERIINASSQHGVLDMGVADVLERGLAFREVTVGQAMTPRVEVESLPATATLTEVVEATANGHARFPVIGDDPDDVLGIVGLAQVVATAPERRASTIVRDVVDPGLMLPETLPLPRALESLRQARRQLAVVIDEHGGFAGIISFEDIAEEVVGEILDEDDLDEPALAALERTGGSGLDSGPLLLSGRTRLDEIADRLDLELPDRVDYETLSGLVSHQLGRLPQRGDVVVVPARRTDVDLETTDDATVQVELVVTGVRRRVPSSVTLTLLPSAVER